MSTIKQCSRKPIVVFVKVDETFTMISYHRKCLIDLNKVIRGQGQGHMRIKVSKMMIFKIYLLCRFSTSQKKFQWFLIDTRPKYLKSLRPDF